MNDQELDQLIQQLPNELSPTASLWQRIEAGLDHEKNKREELSDSISSDTQSSKKITYSLYLKIQHKLFWASTIAAASLIIWLGFSFNLSKIDPKANGKSISTIAAFSESLEPAQQLLNTLNITYELQTAGLLAELKGQPQSAIDDDPHYQYWLATDYSFNKARQQLTRALADDPDNSDLMHMLSGLYKKRLNHLARTIQHMSLA